MKRDIFSSKRSLWLIFFYDSVGSVEATLATNEIFLCEVQSFITKALFFSLTSFVGISCGTITSAVLAFLKVTF